MKSIKKFFTNLLEALIEARHARADAASKRIGR
jgi:hypothetical protein